MAHASRRLDGFLIRRLESGLHLRQARFERLRGSLHLFQVLGGGVRAIARLLDASLGVRTRLLDASRRVLLRRGEATLEFLRGGGESTFDGDARRFLGASHSLRLARLRLLPRLLLGASHSLRLARLRLRLRLRHRRVQRRLRLRLDRGDGRREFLLARRSNHLDVLASRRDGVLDAFIVLQVGDVELEFQSALRRHLVLGAKHIELSVQLGDFRRRVRFRPLEFASDRRHCLVRRPFGVANRGVNRLASSSLRLRRRTPRLFERASRLLRRHLERLDLRLCLLARLSRLRRVATRIVRLLRRVFHLGERAF